MIRERVGKGYYYQDPFDPEHVVRLEEIASPAYVVCPTCSKRAEYWTHPVGVIGNVENYENFDFLKPLFWCPHCIKRDLNRVSAVSGLKQVPNIAGLEVWAKVDVGPLVLWAFNRTHLDGIEAAVLGYELARPPKVSIAGEDWRSRIPGWIKANKNRAKVCKAIETMKLMLPDPKGRQTGS